jgi:hypothetical protein
MKVTLHCNNCNIDFNKHFDSSKNSTSKVVITRFFKCPTCPAIANWEYGRTRERVFLKNSNTIVLIEKPKVKKRYYNLKFAYKKTKSYLKANK